MPGAIMTANAAVNKYGSRFRGMRRVGGKVKLKNSSGKTVTVGKSTPVYHRGNGNFGIYSAAADRKRKGKCYTPKNRTGRGKYRQTDDCRPTRAKKRTSRKKK